MHKYKILGILFVVACSAILFFLVKGGGANIDESTVQSAIEPSSSTQANSQPVMTPSVAQGTMTDEEKRQLAGINFLRKTYGPRINNPYWQLKMIDKLMAMMKKKFPIKWEESLIKLLKEAFPDYADVLIKKLDAHLEYRSWLDSLSSSMTFENQADRRRSMWDKRIELFGEEAYQIWEAALKQDKFDAKMEALAQSSGTFTEKSEDYINGVKAVFGENVLEAGHKTQILGHFLTLENVQADLHKMSVQERKATLHVYRASMGLDEKALKRWDSLDEQRDNQRHTGENYQQKRDTLAKQFFGDKLDQKVSALQTALFGETEAKVIHNEENAGFYRYKQPQKFGFN